MTEPVLSRSQIDDVTLAVWEWPGNGPVLLWAHATGFHGRCWDQVIAQVDDAHSLAPDLRGHGQSSVPPPPYRWRAFGSDLAALVRQRGLRNVVAIGHSMSGHAVTLAAALVPDAFAALVLIDPVIFPRALYGSSPPAEHFAARRRDRWSGPDEMVERFGDRLPFSRWQPAVLRDYCRYGLRPAPNGAGFVLACPPPVEAAIYGASLAADADIYDAIAAVTIPVRIIRCGAQRATGTWDMAASPTAPDLATYFRHAEDVVEAEYTHFLPMEAPAVVAAHVRAMIG